MGEKMSNLEAKIVCRNCKHFEKERNVCHLYSEYDRTMDKDGSKYPVYKSTEPNNRCSKFSLGAMDVIANSVGGMLDENGDPLLVSLEDVPGLKAKLEKEEKGGCYIATAVYGSYEAPEVLTLRLFRDEVLQKNFFGRLFVKTYYFLSPPVAEKLKSMDRLNYWVRKRLDSFVLYLRRKFNFK